MKTTSESQLRQYAARYAQAKQELQDLGFIALGSVQTRYKACGQPGCACQTDPDRRHGPYYHWTRKVKGKTVSVTLTKEEADIYRRAIANSRTLSRVIGNMQQISTRALAIAAETKPPD
jgi:hypothetical protein